MMDFTLGEREQAVADLAAEVLGGADPWKELAGAGLLALGGDGLGVLEVAVLLTEIGRRAAPDSLKALATLMTGALPMARRGGDDLRRAWLPGVAAGALGLTAALREPSEPEPDPPRTLVADGTISGTKVGVPYAEQASRILVPAKSGVVLVDPRGDGVRLTRTPSSTGQPEYTLSLDHAPVAGVLGPTERARDLYQLAVAGACALADGAVAGALALADYIWLACRTDPDAPRHQGISILIVDTRDPGFSWTPIITHDGAHHVNATYYSGVRVPVAMRVGAENEGWPLITAQLNHERVMLGPAGRIAALHDRVRDLAAATRGPDGLALATRPDLRRALARARAAMRVNELLNWQVAAAPAVQVADASVTKVFSSEQLQVIGQSLAEVVGRHANPDPDADPDTAALMTWLDVQLKRNTVLTFGGGVNEIQRELIATSGLGLPRAPR